MQKIMIVCQTNEKGDVDIIITQSKKKPTTEEINIHNYLLNFITDKIKEITYDNFKFNQNLSNNDLNNQNIENERNEE